jgi:hypothetical protein
MLRILEVRRLAFKRRRRFDLIYQSDGTRLWLVLSG